MVGSASRVLAVLESLAASREDGMTAQEVVERAGLPASTAYRLLAEFEEAGLLYRTHNRRLHANFTFERRLSLERISPALVTEACAQVSATLRSACEVVLLRGQNLLWHVVHQHPAQAIRLRAHAGFVRATYELDSITRLALAHCPLERIERTWDTSGFFDVGVARAKVTWEEARAKIAAVAPDEMAFDLLGNAKGVRRFCVAVRDGDRFACLLTVAEAATPMRDETAHVARIREVLMAQRARVEGDTATCVAPLPQQAPTRRARL